MESTSTTRDNSKFWHLCLYGAVTVGVSLASYMVYRKLYADEECSVSGMLQRQTTICKVTPFHNNVRWAATQEDKEKLAYAWMEKYVG